VEQRFWVRIRCGPRQTPPLPGSVISTQTWGRFRVHGIIYQPMQPEDATPDDPYDPEARMATVYLDPLKEPLQ
jgi:hypothetical protein